MTTRTIIALGVFTVVALAFAYMLTGTENEEVYLEKIERERDRQYKYLRFNVDSPLTEDQKKTLGELDFFPIDPTYRVRAKMVPVEDRKMLEIPMTDGSVEKYLKHSYAEFQLNGQAVRLLLLQAAREADKRNFFLAFADATSGESTYGGGRYLNLRQDGKNSITIDFNLAYNPYCAYNPEYACPLPPQENLLEIGIEAGEKDYIKD
ncbi:DUF1684 domain-containing protein [Mongoliitalea daihaiensis]|uniref:DUF1684 domain-containing protein n=1 Tax=Mongoliitalea daihaiensis TaxID=2782006 RepID=UPI001F2C3B7B|nr:DUF1684 domain-containing protein [Mongoliitalea daihaiensis]UJP65323.1 DUF1684 domain-containing protein [Mongoliitalea daihaiensis]